MTELFQTPTHIYYRDFFQDQEVIFHRDKATGVITISAESVARCLGFNNLRDMMSNDEVLDILNEEYKRTGEFPLKEMPPRTHAPKK